jgi:hypothetical protein
VKRSRARLHLLPKSKGRRALKRMNIATNRPAERARNMEVSIAPQADALSGRSFKDTISACLRWLLLSGWNGCDNLAPRPNLWVTGCVLARLAGVSSAYLPEDLNIRIEQALAFLERSQIPGSGWSPDGCKLPDAFTTSWAIIGLRAHRRRIPRAAIDLLLASRHSNGGFTAYPATRSGDGDNPSCPEITVTALRALNMCDRDGGDFLTSRLRNELSSTLAGKSLRFYICSEILDWEGGLAPWPLLSLVSQSAVQFDLESAYDQALLLRMLLRLRNQRARLAAAALQKMQLADGSWPGFTLPEPSAMGSTVCNLLSSGETSLITSVTALSALAMNELQPRLHYHADMHPTWRVRD